MEDLLSSIIAKDFYNSLQQRDILNGKYYISEELLPHQSTTSNTCNKAVKC